MENSNAFAKRRVQNEKKEIFKNPPMLWKIIPSNQYWNIWDVWITASTKCPYHSTPFKLIVQFDNQYPQSLPKFILPEFQRFMHPNISHKNGYICEQTLKTKTVAMTIRQRIDAFVTLLEVPNPDSPLNLQAARLYKEDYRKYYRKAFQNFKGYI